MPNQEVVTVNIKNVECRGEGGVFGHPVNYLNMGEDNHITCQYCGKTFVYEVS
ncbi:MAG: zinc-finger domain-containing protein [Pseudomonadota bacterium]